MQTGGLVNFAPSDWMDQADQQAAYREGAMSTIHQERRLVVQIRWMIRRDMPQVAWIEHLSQEFPWCEEEFVRCLRQRNCIGMVAEHREHVVGFLVYELLNSRLHLLNMAVHPDYRRRGIGTQLVQKIVSKLSQHRRDRITIAVRESNLPAQLFFRACGFRATRVLRRHFPDTDEDAYWFEYRLAGERALFRDSTAHAA